MKIDTTNLSNMIVRGVVAAHRAHFPQATQPNDLNEWLRSLHDPEQGRLELPVESLEIALDNAAEGRAALQYADLTLDEQNCIIVARRAMQAMVELKQWRLLPAHAA